MNSRRKSKARRNEEESISGTQWGGGSTDPCHTQLTSAVRRHPIKGHTGASDLGRHVQAGVLYYHCAICIFPSLIYLLSLLMLLPASC